MDADRWQRLSPLLDALLELESEARRSSLASLRDDDATLADDLEKLLALEAEGDDFLSEPLIAPLPGMRAESIVGPYKLDRMLGEGGMGQVWLATRADGLYQRRVALKLLRPGLADPNLRLRFTRERQILARLEHPHIARLLDAGISADNQPYLALEYVEGEPITDWCSAHVLSVEACVRLFLQVCEAVSHAHANLIVHRDLKPSNIMVTALDEVRLLDFGIAKLLDNPDNAPDNTRTGLRAAFTLHYAAPEQIRGEPVTTMTDVYSLGVVLYELLAGQKPYRLKRQTDAEWEEAILVADPQRPSSSLLRNNEGETSDPLGRKRRARAVNGDLDNIVLKALAKLPEHRYPSVEALSLDLRRYLDGKPVLARPQSITYRFGKFAHRHRWALLTTLLVGVMMAGTLTVVAHQSRQSVEENARTQALQDFVVGLFENAGNTPAGTPLDIRELLDAGVRRGDDELARQPVARAELFGVIARLRLELGDYDQALALLGRQQAILSTLGSVPDGLRLSATTDRGRAQRLLGKPSDCIVTMRPWQPMARREERQLPAQSAEFDSQLGRCERAAGDRRSARMLFQRSLALRRDTLRSEADVVENLADLANLTADAGDARGAEQQLRAALVQLRARVGERHPLAIEMLRGLCTMRRELGDTSGAERDCKEALALAISLRGNDQRATVDARRQLAALLVDEGRFDEARQEFEAAQTWLTARLGPDNDDIARNFNSLAIVAWEQDDRDAALRDSAAAIAIARRQTTRQLAGLLFNRALILHGFGRDAEAKPLLAEALQLRQRPGERQPAAIGDTLRLLGEVNAALHETAIARQQLDRAITLLRDGSGESHPHTLRAQIFAARLDASQGDLRALQQLRAFGEQPETDIERRKAAWLARAYAAQIDCTAGKPSAARTLLDLHQRLQRDQPEGGAVSREIDAIRDACIAGEAKR